MRIHQPQADLKALTVHSIPTSIGYTHRSHLLSQLVTRNAYRSIVPAIENRSANADEERTSLWIKRGLGRSKEAALSYTVYTKMLKGGQPDGQQTILNPSRSPVLR